MDKLTAEIIKNQMIGQTDGHMAAIPNNPILFSIFEVYKGDILATRDFVFKEFISELNEALNKK